MIRFARNVQFQIKDGKGQEFVKLFGAEVLPLLKKQSGFRDELTMLDGRHGVAISMWDDRKNAEVYGTAVYPEVLKKLTTVLDGTPKVASYEVPVTTLAG